jgi:hypothetical protein
MQENISSYWWKPKGQQLQADQIESLRVDHLPSSIQQPQEM